MKVGRDAFDEEAIRLIEEKNPDVEFDWVRILKGPIQTDQKPPERFTESKSRGRERGQQGRPAERSTPADTSRSVDDSAEPSPPVESGFDAVQAEPPVQEALSVEAADEPDVDAGLSSSDPSGVDDDGIEEGTSSAPAALIEESSPTAAHRRLGSEGVLRLRARHAEVLARISERISDPVRKDELQATADRLNPDTWVTDEEVRAGLEQYETVFESLRGALGHRHKRRRRGGRGGDRPGSPERLDHAAAPADREDRPQEDGADVEGEDDESNGS